MKKLPVFMLVLIFLPLFGCGADKTPEHISPVTTAPSVQNIAPVPAPANLPANIPEDAPAEMIDAGNFPKLDGSTATIPLAGAVTEHFTGVTRAEANASVIFSGTRNSYFRLLSGECDIVIAYEPPEEVLDSIAEEIKTNPAYDFKLAPVGRDALVFLVNINNPVQNLTSEQIRGIYSGDITNWKHAGGPDTPIRAFQRNASSGSQTLMQKLVMRELEMSKAPSEFVLGEMGGLVDAVATYNNSEYAIGYNVYYYVTQMKSNELIRVLSVDGVAPDNLSIQKGEYPFINDFYVAVRKDEPEDSPAHILYNWLQSQDGQQLIRNEGYVSVR